MSRESDVIAINQRALLRLKNPIVDERQKIPAGEEVYIRPIHESSMLHFDGDVITTVRGTYAQMFWGNDFSSYATEISSWYNENQLMPTNGRSLQECQEGCNEYFNQSYEEIINKRKEAIESSPLLKMFGDFDEAVVQAFKRESK